MKFGSRKTWKHYLYSWPVVLILLVLVLLLARSVWERYNAAHIMKERRMEAEEELVELQARKEHLQEKVEYLEGERGIEEELRRNFDVAKPGEEVIVLTGEESATPTSTPQPDTEVPWWQFWH